MLVRPYMGPKQTFTVTPATYENVDIEDVAIPTSESTRYGRTLEAADFPTYSFPPASVKYIEKCCVYGQNTSGGSVTIYWKLYTTPSGGSSELVGSGNTAVANNQYFNIDCSVFDVNIGDLIEMSVWGSTNTNVIIMGYEGHISPTRIVPVTYSVCDVIETYTLETPITGSGNQQNSRLCIGSCDGTISATPTTVSYVSRSFVSDNSYGISRYGRGDYASADTGSITTTGTLSFVPRILLSQVLTSVTFRKLLL